MDRKSKIRMPVKYNRLNIAGLNIHNIRTQKFPGLSQNGLAAKMQLEGIEITKNTIQRMEAGLCSISDIQLVIIAKVLQVSVEQLVDESVYKDFYSSDSEKEGIMIAAEESAQE